jgi:hypothetical protein
MSLDRRDFHKLTLAALSGIVAGAAGCGKQPSSQPTGTMAPTSEPSSPAATDVALSDAEQLLLDEPHVCRGLNTCKGLGRGGDNACAGQGTCASVADHACAGQNECKGQGGCGTNPGFNACKGQGSCHVPLMDEIWSKARAAFEAAMQKSGKTVGPAPAKS